MSRVDLLRMVVVFACALVGACAAAPADRPSGRDLVEQLGFSELALRGPVAAPGSVDFYLGQVVLEEFARTGAFVPDETKSYSVIRVPDANVAVVQAHGQPVSLSLCDAGAGVTLIHNAPGRDFHPPGEGEENCSSATVEMGEGYRRIHYRSGQPGVYGVVQLALRDNGMLQAGAVMQGLLPSSCVGDPSVAHSGMFLGTFAAEPADPLEGGCRAPQEEP